METAVLALAVFAVAIYFVFVGITKTVNRFIGNRVAFVSALVMILLMLWGTIDGIIYCSADPVDIPPTAEQLRLGSDGATIHNCDGPLGGTDRLGLYLISPLLICAMVISSRRFLPGRNGV